MTVMTLAVHPQEFGAKLPHGLAELTTRVFLRTFIGRRLVELLPTVPPEVRRIVEHCGPPSDYAGIAAEVLLVAGGRSSDYFAANCAALAEAIPPARNLVLPLRRTTPPTSPERPSSSPSPTSWLPRVDAVAS